MSDLHALYSQATKLTLSLREGVERLESADDRHTYSGGMLSMLSNDMGKKLDELRRISVAMDSMWRMSVVKEAASKRDVWKRKVEQVGDEYNSLRVSLDRYTFRTQKKQTEEQERADLLSRAR